MKAFTSPASARCWPPWAHDQHGGDGPDGHRSHLAAGGRHRHYEHHDGVGGGTDPGNRDPEALGAKERSILALFVTEAATTSALGGLIGNLLGYLISAGVNQIMTITKAGMTIQPSVGSVMVAFGISVGIGVLFGYLPAKRAARLNPIEALRYD